MSKPKVLVTLKDIPGNGLHLLQEKLVSKHIYILLYYMFLLSIYLYMDIYFRFDIELYDSDQSTREVLLKKIQGKFGIFCAPSIKINEELIKAAGK